MKKIKQPIVKKPMNKKSVITKQPKKTVSLMFGFVAIVIGLVGYLFLLTRQVNDLRDNPVAVGFLIAEATDGLNKPLAVHAETGNLFIPEARLVLSPAPRELGDFVYRFSPAENGYAEEVTIASKSLINQAKVHVLGGTTTSATLEAVPKLQSCARGFKLYFEEKADFQGTKVFEKTMNDGRKIYAYQEESCSEQRDEITAYLQQIQGY